MNELHVADQEKRSILDQLGIDRERDLSWEELDSLIQNEAFRQEQAAKLGLPKNATFKEIATAFSSRALQDRFQEAGLPESAGLDALLACEADAARKESAIEVGLHESADWRDIVLSRIAKLTDPIEPTDDEEVRPRAKKNTFCLLLAVCSLMSLFTFYVLAWLVLF